MRRLLRILIRSLTVLSLLLCVATCVLWVRSYWVAERCGWSTSRRDGTDRILQEVNIWSAKGGVGIFHGQYRNLVSDSGAGSPFFHSTDAMRVYPYVSRVAAGVPERRWEWWSVTVARSRRGRADLWVYMHQSGYPVADAQVSTSVVVPWGLMTALFVVLPFLRARRWFIGRRDRRRSARERCVRCGYDLRATPDRCPECGARAFRGRDVNAETQRTQR